jgi:hypothetical protein
MEKQPYVKPVIEVEEIEPEALCTAMSGFQIP